MTYYDWVYLAIIAIIVLKALAVVGLVLFIHHLMLTRARELRSKRQNNNLNI